MNVVEALTRARKRISKPENWTQGTFVRDSDGALLWDFESVEAVCWCASAAIAVEVRWDQQEDVSAALLKALPLGETIVGFNDSHTHTEVLELFDRAIDLVKKEEEK